MWRLALSLLAVLVITSSTPGSTLAQSPPPFQLGFKVLAAMLPAVVGEPLENEHHDPETGNGLQRTSRGLMVWRRSDNFTAFTDGVTTWVNGPFGLQSCSNNVRFSWEGREALPSLPDSAVSLAFSRADDGTWIGTGSVRNPLGEDMDVEVNVLAVGADGGIPLLDVPTLFLLGVPPGASRPIAVRVPTDIDVGEWTWQVDSCPSSARDDFSLDVGTTGELKVDPMLVGTVDALRGVDGGDWMVRVAAENGVLVVRQPTPANVLGTFEPDRNVVALSAQLDRSSAWVRAAVLAHELQHAADAAAGDLPDTSAECFLFEAAAFQRQASVWTGLWRSNLPPDVDELHAELNDVTTTVAHDPEAFAAELVRRYRAECQAIS